MKKMKKILAFVMAMAMVLGMSVTALASGTNPETTLKTNGVTGKSTDKGTIAVKGIDAEATDGTSPVKVYACQIVEPEYNTEDGYFTSKYKGLVSSLNGSDGYLDAAKLSDVTVLASLKESMKLSTDAESKTWTIGEGDSVVSGLVVEMGKQNDDSYSAEVPVGSYLVLVQGADAKFYSPIVVSASYVADDDGESAIENSTLNIANGVAWVKVSTKPTLDKTATVPSRPAGDTNTDAISVNVGDVISYTVTVNPIPNYDGQYPVFKVTDTLSEGLDLEKESANTFADSVEVKVGDDKLELGKHYTVTISTNNAREFTVNFVVNNKYTLGEKDNENNYKYIGKTLTITYKAKVNSNAKMNSVANDNDAKLDYSKDSNINGETGKEEDKTYNYTFDLSGEVNGNNKSSMIDKKGKETTSSEGVALADAEFTLYTAYNTETKVCSSPYNTALIPNGIVVSGDGKKDNPDKGALVIRGLAAGTYYLQETKAPAGYSLNTDVYKIEIDATYYEDSDTNIPTGKEVGQLKSWTVKVTNLNDSTDQGETASFDLEGGNSIKTINVDIPNTKLSSLPSTGGIGTTIFTIGGCAIMIVAAGLFFASRRKSTK